MAKASCWAEKVWRGWVQIIHAQVTTFQARGEAEREIVERGRERDLIMSWVWLEATLPLGIIAGMLCVMGNAQYYIHKAAHGRVFSISFFCFCFWFLH
jgi:hypothetical protein